MAALSGSGFLFLNQMGHSWKYIGLFQTTNLIGQKLLEEGGLETLCLEELAGKGSNGFALPFACKTRC